MASTAALLSAAGKDDIAAFKKVLDLGPAAFDINAKVRKLRYTPMHPSSYRILGSEGTDTRSSDTISRSIIPARNLSTSCVIDPIDSLLIYSTHATNRARQAKSGYSALHFASDNDSVAIVKKLLKVPGINVNSQGGAVSGPSSI
jgi:ankyrin repeat protein